MKFTEVIGKMIDMDIENGTKNVGRSDIFVGARTTKLGGVIEMGVSEEIVLKMVLTNNPKYTPVLLLVDMKVFEEIKNKP